MSVSRRTKNRAIRLLAMAFIVLAPVLFNVDSMAWDTPCPTVAMAQDVPAQEPDDDEQETVSAETEAALPGPMYSVEWRPHRSLAVSAATIYLPPDSLPLLPPPRQMSRA